MSIERLPNAGFRVRWRDVAGIHRSKTFYKGEYQQAKAYEQEVKRAKRLGHLPQLEAGKHAVEDVAAQWFASNVEGLKPRTKALYLQLLESHVLPAFGGAAIGGITPADIEAWLAALDVGPVAKRNAVGILSRVYNFAIRAGYVQMNPCQVAKKPKLPDRRPIRAFDPIEVERIRKALFDRKRAGDAYMVGTMAYAGLRTQEVRDLTWSDVRERTILARSSKTGDFRAVEMLAPLAADIAAWRLQSGAKTANVFPTRTGRPYTKATWDNWRNRIWAGTDEKPGVAPEGTRPYDLRHTFVSLMLNDPDKSRVFVAQQAGHTLEQQETYAHIIAEGKAQDAEQAIREARAQVFGEEGIAVAR